MPSCVKWNIVSKQLALLHCRILELKIYILRTRVADNCLCTPKNMNLLSKNNITFTDSVYLSCMWSIKLLRSKSSLVVINYEIIDILKRPGEYKTYNICMCHKSCSWLHAIPNCLPFNHRNTNVAQHHIILTFIFLPNVDWLTAWFLLHLVCKLSEIA